jgi:hypothetical protein
MDGKHVLLGVIGEPLSIVCSMDLTSLLGTSRRDLPTDDETEAEAADAKLNPIRL